MSIFDFVPAGYILRPVQIQILKDVENAWDKYEVFVIPLSVGGGKSVIAVIIMAWIKSKGKTSAVVTPQVMLQQQYADDFPEIPVLKGKGRYSCESAGNCESHHDMHNTYCEGCPYVAAKMAVAKKSTGIFNLHSYLYTYRNIFGQKKSEDKPRATDLLILDEAHTAFDTLAEHYSWRLYKKKTAHYEKINTIGDALVAMERELSLLNIYLGSLKFSDPDDRPKIKETRRAVQRLAISIEGVQRSPKEFFFDRKKSKVGEYINIQPINFTTLKPAVLHNAKKLVLMSGTINHLDIEKLGLAHRAVYEVVCPSAIAPEQRPVWFMPVANMGFKHQEISLPIMARALHKLINEHPGDKGLIHIPYNLAEKLRPLLNHPRLLWHGKDDKDEKYKEFRASTEPLVLVASGMAEGVDLPYDAGRWQAIVKVMWPSLADPIMQYYSQKEKDYYAWLTIRTIVQQAGRICRTPTDFGQTFILDCGFENLLKYNKKLFPQYFLDALKRRATR